MIKASLSGLIEPEAVTLVPDGGAENIQEVVVPNSGHFIPEEKPEELIQLLLDFAANSEDIHNEKD